MDGLFKNKLDDKKKHQINAANETSQQFNARYMGMNDVITKNMQDMQNFVDQKVFTGELEQKAQDEQQDYAHDYILTDVKLDVAAANLQVYENIRKFGKAEPTQKDRSLADKLKDAATSFGQKVSNRFVASLKGKRAGYDRALLGVIKEQNPEADETTALELHRLIKYTDTVIQMADKKAGSNFRKLEAKRLECITDPKLKEKSQKNLHGRYTFSYLPFTKQYKKGWFGRYYNLDGKRIKIKDNELTPEEYNKQLLEGLMTETDANVITDKKILKQNRDKKAVVLQRITQEMIEYGEKFDPKKMTDRYVAEHIIELHEYYSRLNAFQQLFIENQWFFMGRDKTEKKKGALGVGVNDAVDPAFTHLVKTHIIDMAAPVANFMEAHYRSHCLKPDAEFSKRKNYFRVDEQSPKFLSLTDDEDDLDLFEKQTVEETITRGLDDAEKNARYQAFGSPFVVQDVTKMNEEEKAEYDKRYRREVDMQNEGITLQLLKNRVRKVRYEQKRPLTKDVNLTIKKDLDAMRESAEKSMKRYNDAEKNEKDKLPIIPYASMTATTKEDLVMMDLKFIQEKMHSTQGTSMYMFYGPEIDVLYGKLYATCRLQAELIARRNAISKQLNIPRIRELERGIADKSVKKSVRAARQKELDTIRKDNLAVYKFASKNAYAGFANDILAEERLKRAENEYDEIGRKTEYTKTQIELCSKALKFFLSDPQTRIGDDKDYDVIKRFLNKENLGYMFDVDKVNSYDTILDEAIAYTERDIRMGDNAENLPKDVTRKIRGPKERAARIYQVRRRAMLANDTKESIPVVSKKLKDPNKAFAKLLMMEPVEFAKLNFKGDVPMATPEQKEVAGDNIALMHFANSRAGVFSPKFYKDKKAMAAQLAALKKEGAIPKETSLERFMADIEVKIKLLNKWSPNYNLAVDRQMNADYAYLDTDSLEEMSKDRLKLLKDNLTTMSKTLEARMNEAYRKPKEYGEANGKIIVNYNDEDQSPTYRKRKAEYNNCLKLISIVQVRIDQVSAMNEYEEITEEAYYHSLNERMEELELEHAIQEEFYAADANYIRIRKLFASDKCKKFDKSYIKIMAEKSTKDKTYFDQDKNLEKEADDLLFGLREIPVGPALTDLCNRNIGDGAQQDDDELVTLITYAESIQRIDMIMTADAQWGSDQSLLKMKAYLNREDNKELLNEINARLEVLKPLFTAVNNFLRGYGFIGVGYLTRSGEMKGSDDLTEEEEAQLDARMYAYNTARSDALNELKKKVENADQVLTEGYKPRLFRMMYESGEKLSLSKIKDWEKIVKKIEKDGYYSRKQSSDDEGNKWMKAAARQLLAGWPQSFEDFYAEHAKYNTGKAVEESFKNATGLNMSAFVEDTAHTADISSVISRKEIQSFQALNTDDRKRLDERLKKEGYSQKFKYLLKDVEVNGIGQPATARAKVAWGENAHFVSIFVNKDIVSDGMKDNSYHNSMYKRQWVQAVMERFKEAVNFKITSEMTDPKYIKANFAYLYEKTREFAALKELYDHEKSNLNDPEILKDCYMNQKTVIQVRNAFGPKTRSLYAMFFELIQAYAKVNFVDEEGHFDLGLSAEEMFGKQIDDPFGLRSKDKKKKKETEDKGPDKAANRRKINEVLKDRQNQFKRLGNRVRAELDREVLAEKVSEAEELNQTLAAIKVNTSQSVFKMVQHKEFAGKINDVNLLMQSPELARMSARRTELLRTIGETKAKLISLTEQEKEYKIEGNKEKLDAVVAEIGENIKILGQAQVKLSRYETRIENYQRENHRIYDRYNDCHDEKGDLKTVVTYEDGTRQEFVGQYVDFQVEVYKDIKSIYEDFKKMVKKSKTNGGKEFTEPEIIKEFKKGDMAVKLRNLKKLDLYLGLLEVDRTRFVDKANKFNMMTRFSQHTEELRSSLKKRKAESEDQIRMKNEMEKRVNDMTECHKFITEVMKDMDQKKENPVRLLHDYVQLIYLTLKSYGVSPDGEIEEDKIRTESDGELTSREIREAAYDEADKVGDAHIALEREISEYMGFDKTVKKKK